MELIIITSVVIVIFVAFEILTIKESNQLIKELKSHIEEQQVYIKKLENDYKFCSQKLIKSSKDSIIEKQ